MLQLGLAGQWDRRHARQLGQHVEGGADLVATEGGAVGAGHHRRPQGAHPVEVDAVTGRVEPLAGFPGAKHLNPQWAPDGASGRPKLSLPARVVEVIWTTPGAARS